MRHILTVLAVFTMGLARGEENPPSPEDASPLQHTVLVAITASGEMKERVEGYIYGAIREREDISLVSTDGHAKHALKIVGFRVTAGQDEAVTGYVLSVLFLSRPPLWEWLQSPKSKESMNQVQKDAIEFFMAGSMPWDIGHHAVQTGPMGDLEKVCSEIVADFDAKVLEPDRETHRQVKKLLQEQRERVKGPGGERET